MASDFFYFKQFAIKQRQSAMKVGTDGVLLGAWADIPIDCKNILDIGTGTGVIAIMTAQRTQSSSITAIEIEPQAAQEARYNASKSSWSQRIDVQCISFQDFADNYNRKFDFIISNPPYFNGSYKSIQTERTAARHSGLLSSDDLLEGVSKVLDFERGKFVAIFPYETGAVFIAKASEKKIFCNRMCSVYPKENYKIKRIMAEFSFHRKPLKSECLIIAVDNENYTDEYKKLTKDFYLKF